MDGGGDTRGGGLEDVLRHFPPVSFAMAYGSGVFKQASYSDADQAAAMVDLVFAVDDPEEWHAANLACNRAHYSFLGGVGARRLAAIQCDYGAKLYYNTLVRLPAPHEGMVVKYGVISTADLVDDLVNWRTFYVSGRMHKPVRILKAHAAVQRAAETNLRSAIAAALLLLPATFSDVQLFTTISALSYAGDFRMLVGENPDKVRNIVDTNLDHFRHLYRPRLERFSPALQVQRATLTESTTPDAPPVITRDWSTEATVAVARQLPASLQQEMSGGASGWWGDVEASPPDRASAMCAEAVRVSLAALVGRYARSQSVKGVLSGGTRSITYVSQKLGKWATALLRRRAAVP